MDALTSFENFSYQVYSFGLMEDFDVQNFIPESDSNSESPMDEEEEESAEDENREETDEAKGRGLSKVNESARKDGA